MLLLSNFVQFRWVQQIQLLWLDVNTFTLRLLLFLPRSVKDSSVSGSKLASRVDVLGLGVLIIFWIQLLHFIFVVKLDADILHSVIIIIELVHLEFRRVVNHLMHRA